MTIAILYGTLTAFAYYIGARAKITEWLWSRYPAWLDYWMVCPACIGFWYGLGCGFLGAYYDWPLFGLDPDHWLTVLIAGAIGTVWTPIIAYAHTKAWTELSVTVEPVETPANPNCRSL